MRGNGISKLAVPGHETTNTQLAAALTAVGIPLDERTPCRKLRRAGDGREVWCFFFQAQDATGTYRTEELCAAWADPGWHERNPEHPFAYIKCAFQNRERLLDRIKAETPIALLEKGGKLGFVSLDANQELVDRVVAKL